MQETLHIYTRVSTTTQEEEGTSLETQLEFGIQRANKLGMLYEVWNEGGKSSSKDDFSNRPVLTELLQRIDEGDVKNLYVWNTDRLSRNINTWGMIRYRLIKNDVTLHTPTGKQILSDPQTNLLIGILSEISQYENKLRTERFRLGKLKRINQGGWMGGPPPFGYSILDSKLIPNKDEAIWVKYIYEQYLEGKSIDEIRNQLLKNGVVTRRGKVIWSHGSIDKLLTNTHYEGYYTYHDKKSDEVIRVTCPQLLDFNLIKSVRDFRKKRSYGKIESKRIKTSNQKYNYLLSGLLVCGHCGAKYGGNYKTNQTSYYMCLQKTNKYKTKYTERHVVCNSKRNIRIDRTDEIVWKTVIDVISNSYSFKETVKTELLGQTSHRKSSSDLKKLLNQQTKIKKEINKVTDSIVNFETTRLISDIKKSDIENVIKGLEEYRLQKQSELEQISNNILSDREEKKWIDWVKEFGSRINRLSESSLSIEERKKFISGVVEKITVNNTSTQEHELIIEFRLPYVGDEIIFKNSENKSLGYDILGGQNTKSVKVDLLKKSTT